MHPFEHARSCTCPCPTCIDLHRKVLAHVGLLKRDARPSHIFVYGHDSLAIAESEGDDRGRHFNLYDDICTAHGIEKAPPYATIGWLLPTREEARLLAVRAASDPHGVAVDHALTRWGRAHGRVVDTSLRERG